MPRGSVTDQAAAETPGLVTDQARQLRSLTDIQWKIFNLMFCDVPRSMANIMSKLELTHRTFFRRRHLGPLLVGGVIHMTHPDQPNHPDQAYVLTEAGVEIKARRVNEPGNEG